MNVYRCENCTRFPTCLFRQDPAAESLIKKFLGEAAWHCTKNGVAYIDFSDFCDHVNFNRKDN